MSASDNFQDLEVYSCAFEINLAEAEMAIKFPCSYYVEIRSMNNKISIATTRNKVTAVNSIAVFNELIKFETELLFNKQAKLFIKKQVLLLLNLLSARRPDEQKLVGRLVLDLSQAIQTANYANSKAYKLDYCSVKALLTFSCKYLGKKISKTSPSNFDKDSFSDFQSFVAGIHNKDYPVKQKSFQQNEKTVQIGKRVKNNDSFEHNRIIQQSNNEDNESKINTGRTSHKIVPNGESQGNQHRWKEQSGEVADVPNTSSDNFSKDFQILNRIKSDLSEKSYPKKQSLGAFHSATSNQYEQILKNSHSQEKRIWEQEKRMLNEQILREKQEQTKLKQKVEWMEKKVYESELKLCTLEAKIEHSNREMTILEREKQLELKELRTKLERVTKEKEDRSYQLECKQLEIKQAKEKIKSKEEQRDRSREQLEKQRLKLEQNLENALKRVMSSQELLCKLQKEKKQSSDVLEEGQKKLLVLSSQNSILKSKLNILEGESANWKIEKSKNQQQLSAKLQSLKSEHEREIKQFQDKIYDLQLTIEKCKKEQLLMRNEHKSKVDMFETKVDQLTAKLASAHETINQLEGEIEKKGSEQFNLQSNHKKELQLLQVSNSKKLREQALRYVEQIEKLQLGKTLQQKQILTMADQLKSKEEQIRLLEENLKQKTDRLQQSQREHKEYINQLEKQILLSAEQMSIKDSGQETLKNEVLKMKNTISEMKIYQKGLEEDILKLENTLQEAQFAIQQIGVLQTEFNILQSSSGNQIKRLETVNANLNSVLIQRNVEIEDLIANKNESKEYIFGLQSQILKLTEDNENAQADRKRSLDYEKIIANLKEQIRQKNIEINKVGNELFEMRKEKIQLNELVLKLKQENDSTQLQKNREKTSSKETVSFELQQKLREGERRMQQKTNYLKQLEEKVLHYNTFTEENEKLNKKIAELTDKIGELTEKIAEMSEYQRGLEQKILNDYQKMEMLQAPHFTENIDKAKQQEEIINSLKQTQRQLEDKIKGLQHSLVKQNEDYGKLASEREAIISHLKEYQEGLEERILFDYEKAMNGNGLEGRLEEQKVLINHLKEYQMGLEENILQAYETNTSRTLQQKVKELEDVIKHLKQYQQGLEQKILEDHQNVEGDVGLKSSIKLLETQINHQKEYQTGLEEKIIADHQMFEKMNDLGTVAENIHQPCSQEKERLQQEIARLQANIKNVMTPEDEDFLVLQGQINQKNLYIEELEFTVKNLQNELGFLHNQMNQPENPKDLGSLEQQQHQKQILRNMTVIRVIEANSSGQEQQLDSPKAETQIIKVSHPDTGKERKQIGSASYEKQNDMKIKQLESRITNLESQKAILQEEIKSLKKRQSNEQKNHRSGKIMQQQMKSQSVLERQNLEIYIKELESVIKEHESRIKQFKGKEDKMQETLFIIEEESYKIVGELNLKYEECEKLAQELQRKQALISQLYGRNQQVGSKEAEFNSLLKKYSEKDQQISCLKQKLSIHSQQSSKYDDLIQQLEQLENNRRENFGALQEKQSKIKSLESELKEVNDQLMTSKRLVGKLRENRQNKSVSLQLPQDYASTKEENAKLMKRVEQLEQQVFTYQSGENEKDIVIESLRIDLANAFEGVKTTTESKTCNQATDSTVVALQTEIEDLKSKVKISVSESQSKTQNIQHCECEIKKLEALLKAERLDYYGKRRENEQETQSLLKRLEEQSKQLASQENKIIELEDKIIQNEKNMSALNEKYLISQHELETTKKAYSDEHIKHLEELRQNKMASLKNEAYIESLEAQIQQNFNLINSKNEELKRQYREESRGEESKQLKQLQNQLNFYSGELSLVTKKLEEIEPAYNEQKSKLEECERVIEELSEQLKICQQQNSYHLATTSKEENKRASECLHLSNRVSELEQQLRLHTENSKINNVKIEELECLLRETISDKEKAIIELEEKQMEHMNTELDLQFKLREKNQKSQVGLASSFTENQQKKSLSASQEVGAHDIIPASKVLKELITSRSNRSLSEKQIQVMVGRITQLEDQLYGASSITKQKGLILEKTRLVSMEFTKLKVNIMKSKLPNEERMRMLTFLKPIETCIKDILQLSQIYSENLLTLDLGENSRN